MRLPLPNKLFRHNGILARRVRLWAGWDRLCDVAERTVGPLWFAYHNAKVIVDFERRMSSVIHEATGGLMSKPYYTLDAMLPVIAQYVSRSWDEGYDEGRRDTLQELGEPDPMDQIEEH